MSKRFSSSSLPPTHRVADPAANGLSIPQSADRLGIGRSTLYRLLKSGEIKSFYIGARRMIRPCTLDQFVARQERVASRQRHDS